MTLPAIDPLAITSSSDIEILLSHCDGPLCWEHVFGNRYPVEIEIGSGKGKFIIRSAHAHPDKNFLGIERAGKFYRILKERALRAGISNIRIVRCDAAYFLRKYIPAASVHAYHIYFPDPWPKKRHHKRRLVTQEFIALLSETLMPGGHLFFATDFREYFEIITMHARACPTIQEILCTTILPGTVDPEQAPTNYERKYLMQGREIYKAAYIKRLSP
ncbi:MAG: tRNA (guanosine(46)-N7)-methyltransferase TrmB [Desulfobacterota bacterium]|nr:tRNA (guanosine(46)-N7)-methyltransferase TrmB [Thermodesulfobacteriota bacterium]